MNPNDLLSIREAAEQTCEGRISPHSVRRWGIKGVGHPRVKLPLIRLGGTYFVRRADAELFRQAIANAELYRRRKREERISAAVAELEKAGA